jgi:hypothetical protein
LRKQRFMQPAYLGNDQGRSGLGPILAIHDTKKRIIVDISTIIGK